MSSSEGKKTPVFPAETIKSLPLWYQALAQVLADKKELIITEKPGV